MTNLDRKIERRLRGAEVSFRGKKRAIIVGFGVGNVLTFRLAGCKVSAVLSLEDLWWEAHRRKAAAARARQRKRPLRVE